MPRRIADLPRDKRGYPVPWFVFWLEGEPHFPIANSQKRVLAIVDKCCWVCGDNIGAHKAFVVGPMCGVNRTTAEPPCHLECAEYSVQACPFLKNPNMKRIEDDLTKEAKSPGGVMITRNPGVSVIWVTKKFGIFKDSSGGWLINLGEPVGLQFWKEGRRATKEEVLSSIEAGCHAVEALAEDENDMKGFVSAKKAFVSMVENWFLKWDKPENLETIC